MAVGGGDGCGEHVHTVTASSGRAACGYRFCLVALVDGPSGYVVAVRVVRAVGTCRWGE